ncbi:DUF4870 domain-containing protein [Mucilaginibacter sp. HD30]
MRNIISEKIKTLRIARGLSQAEMAAQTALSLRTIQRIENGNTDARGDSLIRIAKALNTTPEELSKSSVDKNIQSKAENYNYLLILNLSALCFLALPLLGIIMPLLLWLLKKETIADIDRIAKSLLNFQISWLLLGVILLIILIILSLFFPRSIVGIHSERIMLIGIISMYAINLTYIIFNAILLLKKRTVIYQPAIIFFKD